MILVLSVNEANLKFDTLFPIVGMMLVMKPHISDICE